MSTDMRQSLPVAKIPSGLSPFLVTTRGMLFADDCLKVMKALRPASIDTVFADPPFNLGKDYGVAAGTDSLVEAKYLGWCYEWMDESIRILKPGGAFFIYILPRWGFHFAKYLEESGMEFRHWIALSMKGTFPRGQKLYPAHYALLYFTKGKPRVFNKLRLPVPSCRHCGKDIKDYGGHRKFLNPEGLNLTDFWEDTSPARHSKFKARSGVNELKPVIAERCFGISTHVGDIVLDPFGGGGSSFVAAETLDRHWIGTEISTYECIKERLEQLPGSAVQSMIPTALSQIWSN